MKNSFVELTNTKSLELMIDQDQQLNLFDIQDASISTTINLYVAKSVNLEINMTSLNYSNYTKSFVLNIFIIGEHLSL